MLGIFYLLPMRKRSHPWLRIQLNHTKNFQFVYTRLVSRQKTTSQMIAHVQFLARKYRDELRPRHGLLRSREFVMKDLYTFDYHPSLALATYHEVREIYARLFDELKLPYLVAEADSGDIGGI